MSLNIQTPVTGITGMLGTAPFENYMAATVEEIKIGRNPVTSIAPLPNRVFDVLWKLNLNASLSIAGVKSTTVIDDNEHGYTTQGYSENFSSVSGMSYAYNLTTNSNSKIIKVVLIKNSITHVIEKIIYGEVPIPGSTYVKWNHLASMSYNGTYLTSAFPSTNRTVINTTTKTILTMPTVGAYSSSQINDNGTVFVYGTYSSSNYTIDTFKTNVAFTTNTVLSSSNGSTGSFSLTTTGTVNVNKRMFYMNGSNTIMVVSPFTTSFNTYGFTGEANWELKNTYTNPSLLQILSISLSNDGNTVAYSDSSNAYILKRTGWTWDIVYSNSSPTLEIKLNRNGDTLVIRSSGYPQNIIIAKSVLGIWTSPTITSIIWNELSLGIYFTMCLNPVGTSMIISIWSPDAYGFVNPTSTGFFDFNGTSWTNTRNDKYAGYAMSDDFNMGMVTMTNAGAVYPNKCSNTGFVFKTRNIGIGSTEIETYNNLAIKLATDGSNVIELPTDGSQNVYSSISPSDISAVSSSFNNSFVTYQASNITNFMKSIKGETGTYKWYNNNSTNKQSIQTQVKLGLAQLFDKDPQLNNLIGSASSSSSFIDSSKIATKMQLNSDTFYTKFFSEQQLREVLSAVTDKGSRVAPGADGVNTFNFSAGDTISAMLKVTDTDTTSLNSDRWMITLQHSTS
jgi:hypothetical protein